MVYFRSIPWFAAQFTHKPIRLRLIKKLWIIETWLILLVFRKRTPEYTAMTQRAVIPEKQKSKCSHKRIRKLTYTMRKNCLINIYLAYLQIYISKELCFVKKILTWKDILPIKIFGNASFCKCFAYRIPYTALQSVNITKQIKIWCIRKNLQLNEAYVWYQELCLHIAQMYLFLGTSILNDSSIHVRMFR